MLRAATAMLTVLLLLTAVGCGDTHDKVMNDMATSMEDLGDALADVKDVDSAKANSDRISKIAADMQDISDRANKLDKPSEEKVKELKEKYGDRFDKASEKLFKEMIRVAFLGEEVQNVLDDSFNELKKDSSPPKWFE